MWQEPKTDWTVNDYFNYTDYNRIKNNIAYLREQALKLYINFYARHRKMHKCYS